MKTTKEKDDKKYDRGYFLWVNLVDEIIFITFFIIGLSMFLAPILLFWH